MTCCGVTGGVNQPPLRLHGSAAEVPPNVEADAGKRTQLETRTLGGEGRSLVSPVGPPPKLLPPPLCPIPSLKALVVPGLPDSGDHVQQQPAAEKRVKLQWSSRRD